MLQPIENLVVHPVRASAEVVLDSYSHFTGFRLVTVRWTYPKLFDPQVQKHGSLRNNSESARARSYELQRFQVTDDPFVPRWSAEAGTMWGDLLPPSAERDSKCRTACLAAVDYADNLIADGVHRQDAARYLTPWAYMSGIATADEAAWEAFIALREAQDAQAAMVGLAKSVRLALSRSTPVERIEHYPLVHQGEDEPELRSAARCARVSYGIDRVYREAKSPEHELRFAQRLWGAGHVSPFEHPCVAVQHQRLEGPFWGWSSYRLQVGGERSRPRDWRLEKS